MKQADEIRRANEKVPWQPRPTLGSVDYAGWSVYREEQERIWWGDWICAGRAEEVASPGDYVVRDIAGESIFITCNLQGELRAFYNVCAHRGTKFMDEPGGAFGRPSSARTTHGRSIWTDASSARPT